MRIWGLRIQGHDYVVIQHHFTLGNTAEIDPTTRCATVVKRHGESYRVSRHPWGLECTCGDFIFRRNHLDPRGCKHILALLAWSLI